MKKLVVSFVSSAALTAASIAMAGGMDNMAAPVQSNDSGFIISGNVGYGKVNYNAANLRVSSSRLSGFAWNGNLGYQFNRYFTLESGYTHFRNISIPSGNIKTQGVDLLAKGILPINSQFNVFAKAGAMDVFTRAPSVVGNHSRITPEFGIGTGYNVTPHVALTLQAITTLAMKGPHAGSFTQPATYAGYAGISYKF